MAAIRKEETTGNGYKSDVRMRVVNVFALVDFGGPFDLAKLSLTIPDSEYEPESSPGVIVRTVDPRSCTTIYRTGTARCTGCRSPAQVTKAVEKVTELLSAAGQSVQAPEIDIRNVVCVGDFHRMIDLERLASAAGDMVQYEPEQFPGAFFRPGEKGSGLVFKSGRVVFTGVRSIEQAEDLQRLLLRILRESGV